MTVRLNPNVPDNFLVLAEDDSFEGYATMYGDRIAEHYENNGAVVIPHMPIACDLEFLQSLTLPFKHNKIGTMNGLDVPVVQRFGDSIGVRGKHPLVALMDGADVSTLTANSFELAIYLSQQIQSFNAQLRAGLRLLFPASRSLQEANTTWRLTETPRGPMHLDCFHGGKPLADDVKRLHKLKVFINIDAGPRHWRTSYPLPELLKVLKPELPSSLPLDINQINRLIGCAPGMQAIPAHDVAYGPMSAVIVNGDMVAHQVVSGRRMVCFEGMCDSADMLSAPVYERLPEWLADAGYAVAEDAQRFYEDVTQHTVLPPENRMVA